jgi:hypothetical protein
LKETEKRYPGVIKEVFGSYYDALIAVLDRSLSQQITWAQSISTSSGYTINEPWHSLFSKLGLRYEFQHVAFEDIQLQYNHALKLCDQFHFDSQRAVALMFDIIILNGGISPQTKTAYDAMLANSQLEKGATPDEVERMALLSEAIANGVTQGIRKNVESRLMICARGAGAVYGRKYNLSDFGITLANWRSG